MVSFWLFAATKNHSTRLKILAKKKTWGMVNSSVEVHVEVTVEVISFEAFWSLVIDTCNTHFSGAGTKDKFEVTKSCTYQDLLNMACEVGKLEVSLLLKMENPLKVAKHAQIEDLLASQALQNVAIRETSGKQRAADSDLVSEGLGGKMESPRCLHPHLSRFQ
ncbi:hypothetical protein VP01_573g7 [Puccinia sorghi]|uniref:Uncharacterized protein n=1 Tax=Puccinia sorghi TaxID=27349 RepID=A0A0L6UJA9_9BASI|nr:hypothetical protein VP01_573g7 [Puccinia sorghi]